MINRFADQVQSFVDHWNYDEINEDCLRLNVWTPALTDGKKRPVMVWLHGGGFNAGNGIEQDGYHGENFSRAGDVVFVSLNHRLGALGFSNFSAVGGRFAEAVNVGMLDIVEALRWVRDNITAFGGDPDNVTISGQSGGSAKVCTLAAMPAAKGLFHKAVSLSGSSIAGLPRENTEKLAQEILREAGAGNDPSKLQAMSWREYQELANRVAKRLQAELPAASGRRGGFSPTGDGRTLPTGKYFSDVLSADIPMLFCTTFNESSPSRSNAALENATLSEVKEYLKPRFGDATDRVVGAYADAFPHAKPIEVWSLVASNRQPVIAAANAKANQSAQVYVAWFGFQPELFDNRMRAFHCLDISFWFLNTDRMYTHTGGGSKARALSRRMATAMLAFMRTGNLANSDLPDWPRYDAAAGQTMILNTVCEVKRDPDREARASLPT